MLLVQWRRLMRENLTEKEIIELKGVIEILTANMQEVIRLDPVKDQVTEAIHSAYAKGLDRIDREFKPAVNVQMPGNATRQLEMLNNYTFQNIQNVGDEIGNSLRQELQRGLLNGDSKAELVNRVKATFKEKKFRDRFKMVIRTETLRANNTAALEGANQVQDSTQIEMKKWLDVTMDDRTSLTCREENKQYGTKDKAIPLDQEFEYTFQNKTYRAQSPPFHPNCRTIVRFIRAGQPKWSKVGDTE